jgi:hypothetical protein
MTPTKTVQTALLALQSVASNSVAVGAALDVANFLGATIGIRFGRRTASALTSPAIVRIEYSFATSGDSKWLVKEQRASSIVAAESEAVSGTVNAGTNVITVASTTNLAAGDLIYIDNGTIANSEWGRVKSIVSNTSVTIEDNLTNAQTSSTLYDQADIFAAITLDLTSIKRIRAVCDGSGTGQAVAVEVLCTTFDSIG